jgi:hypothetical protein
LPDPPHNGRGPPGPRPAPRPGRSSASMTASVRSPVSGLARTAHRRPDFQPSSHDNGQPPQWGTWLRGSRWPAPSTGCSSSPPPPSKGTGLHVQVTICWPNERHLRQSSAVADRHQTGSSPRRLVGSELLASSSGMAAVRRATGCERDRFQV